MQIIQSLSKRIGIAVEDILNSCEIKKYSRAYFTKPPQKMTRKTVQGNALRALQNILMFPSLALHLSPEDKNLLTQNEHSELFEEVLRYIQEIQGTQEMQETLSASSISSINFLPLSDYLRNQSPQAELFNDIFKEILSIDKNVYDLLVLDQKNTEQLQHYQKQEALRGEELKSGIEKIRYETLCQKLEKLASISPMTLEQKDEFITLSKERDKLKAQLNADKNSKSPEKLL